MNGWRSSFTDWSCALAEVKRMIAKAAIIFHSAKNLCATI